MTEVEFEDLLAMEETLETELDSSIGFVDGHDFGSGEMNLFVHTDEPRTAFAAAAACLGSNARWDEVRAASRPLDGDRYTVIWPASLLYFSVT